MQETLEIRALFMPDPCPDWHLEEISKKCIKCKVEKDFTDFVKDAAMRFGVSGTCKDCKNAARRKENVTAEQNAIDRYNRREYYRKNTERVKELNNGWRKQNRQFVLAGKKRYRTENRDKCNAASQAWRDANREYSRAYFRARSHLRVRKYRPRENVRRVKVVQGNATKAKRVVIRTHVSIRVRINRALRVRVRHFLKSGKLANELLGCDFPTLKMWFEINFALDAKYGMNWENYGAVWEIDHVRACATFDMANHEEYKKCFHWKNLAPVPVRHNRSKGKRTSYEDERRQEIRLNIFKYYRKLSVPPTSSDGA